MYDDSLFHVVLLVPPKFCPDITCSGVARSQTTPGHCTRFFVVVVGGKGAGWGHAPLVTYCILEVATQMRLFLKCRPSLESGVVLTHDFAIRACSTGLH